MCFANLKTRKKVRNVMLESRKMEQKAKEHSTKDLFCWSHTM